MQRMVRRGGIFEERDVGLRCKIRMKRRTAPGREALRRALWPWGDTDHLYRWQEYYNAMVAQLSRAFGCRLVDLRAEFLKSRVFPTLIGADGIHPTQAGHDLIHHTVQSALAY